MRVDYLDSSQNNFHQLNRSREVFLGGTEFVVHNAFLLEYKVKCFLVHWQRQSNKILSVFGIVLYNNSIGMFKLDNI